MTQRIRRRTTLAALAAAWLLAAPTWALEPGKDGFYLTGSGTRVKTFLIVKVNVYVVSHYMRELPAQKSRRAVIEADCDKRFVWRMLRDVDAEKVRDTLRDTLRDAYGRNNYRDQAKISQLTAAFAGDIKEGTLVTIAYEKASKTTTLTVGDKRAAIAGDDFMRATWSLFFGNMPDQPALGDELISRLP